jgi:DNA-binding response OmpR family regulator
MSKPCILQVEDDANDVFLLQRAFMQAGISNPVHVATDGQMAIDYLAGVHHFADRARHPLPALVLLDLKLPRKSGREVLQWVRGQPGLRRLIVIIFTSAPYVGDVGLAYDLGANSFLVKPTDFSQFLDVARVLKTWWLDYNHFAPLNEAVWPAPLFQAEVRRLWAGEGNPS